MSCRSTPLGFAHKVNGFIVILPTVSSKSCILAKRLGWPIRSSSVQPSPCSLRKLAAIQSRILHRRWLTVLRCYRSIHKMCCRYAFYTWCGMVRPSPANAADNAAALPAVLGCRTGDVSHLGIRPLEAAILGQQSRKQIVV